MTNRPQQSNSAPRSPDCVTEVRKSNMTLTVSGHFKQDATETAADKMAKVIATESMMRTFHEKGVS